MATMDEISLTLSVFKNRDLAFDSISEPRDCRIVNPARTKAKRAQGHAVVQEMQHVVHEPVELGGVVEVTYVDVKAGHGDPEVAHAADKGRGVWRQNEDMVSRSSGSGRTSGGCAARDQRTSLVGGDAMFARGRHYVEHVACICRWEISRRERNGNFVRVGRRVGDGSNQSRKQIGFPCT